MLYPATKWYFPAGTINSNISYINKLVTSSDFQDSAIDLNGVNLADNSDYFKTSNSSWNNKYFYKGIDNSIKYQSTSSTNYTLSKIIQNAYNICPSNINTSTAKLISITPNIQLASISNSEYVLGSRFIWAYQSQNSPNTSTLIFNPDDGEINMTYDSEYIYISNISAVISVFASSQTFLDSNNNLYYPAQVVIEALGGSGTSYSYSYSYSPNSGGGISGNRYNGYVSNLYVDLYNKNLYQTILNNLDKHNYVNEFHSNYISYSDTEENYIVNKHYSQNDTVVFKYGDIAKASVYQLLENNEDALYAWHQRVGTVGSMVNNPENSAWGGMPECTYTYLWGDTGPYYQFPWAIVIHELNITFSPNNELFVLYAQKDTDNTYFFKQWITLVNGLQSHFQIDSGSTSYQFINLKLNGVSINRVNYTFEISTNAAFTNILPTYVFFNYASSHNV